MKREIEEQFGEPYAHLAVLLNEVRGWAKGTLPTYQDRKEFFEGIVNGEPDPVALLRGGGRGAGGARADRPGPARTRAAGLAEPEARGRRSSSSGSRATTASGRRCSGVSLTLRAGADAGRVRPQRRRQDDAAAHPRDAAAPARGRRCACSARACPSEAWAVRGRVGLLGHEPLLYRELSARENLRFHARLHGVGQERVAELLEAVAMSAARGRAAAHALARAWCSAWRSRAPCCTTRSCCCWTSPTRTSTRPRVELVEPLIGAARGRTRVICSHDPAGGWPRPTSCWGCARARAPCWAAVELARGSRSCTGERPTAAESPAPAPQPRQPASRPCRCARSRRAAAQGAAGRAAHAGVGAGHVAVRA